MSYISLSIIPGKANVSNSDTAPHPPPKKSLDDLIAPFSTVCPELAAIGDSEANRSSRPDAITTRFPVVRFSSASLVREIGPSCLSYGQRRLFFLFPQDELMSRSIYGSLVAEVKERREVRMERAVRFRVAIGMMGSGRGELRRRWQLCERPRLIRSSVEGRPLQCQSASKKSC